MYIIRVTAQTKEDLPIKMLEAVKELSDMGLLHGLIHSRDDVVLRTDCGWVMYSRWDTPEEVSKL